MPLNDIIPIVKECAYGMNGVITNLQMGHTQKFETEMSKLRILFKCANHSLRNNHFLTSSDFSPFIRIIAILEQYSTEVPWVEEFANELKQILMYKGD